MARAASMQTVLEGSENNSMGPPVQTQHLVKVTEGKEGLRNTRDYWVRKVQRSRKSRKHGKTCLETVKKTLPYPISHQHLHLDVMQSPVVFFTGL